MNKASSLPGRPVAIYVRVSTDEQASKDEGSLDSQVHRCKQYLSAMAYGDDFVQNAKVFREEGYSAKDVNRPQLQALLKDIRAGRVGLLLFTELSRISRSVSDFLHLSMLLAAKEVKFISLREDINTATPHGKLVLIMLVALAQFERETTAERTKANMRARAERGLWSGGVIPLGYTPDPERSGHLQVVPEEGALVKEMFSTYLATGTLKAAARSLKERGYRRNGREISWAGLAHILQNPVYRGLKEVNRASRLLPLEEQAKLPDEAKYRTTPGRWEPLVDAETFERAGRLLAENYARNGAIIADKHHEYFLTGLVFCGVCRVALEGASQRPNPGDPARYYYYRHPSKTRQPGCRTSIRAEVVEDEVLRGMRKLATSKAMLSAIVSEANKLLLTAAPEVQEALRHAKGKLPALVEQRSNLSRNLMAAPPGVDLGSFWADAEALGGEERGVRTEIARLEKELADLGANEMKVESYTRALRSFAKTWGKANAFERAELISMLVDVVVITPEEVRVALVGDLPDEGALSADAAYAPRSKWLPLLDLN